jgi:hypothetical protein
VTSWAVTRLAPTPHGQNYSIYIHFSIDQKSGPEWTASAACASTSTISLSEPFPLTKKILSASSRRGARSFKRESVPKTRKYVPEGEGVEGAVECGEADEDDWDIFYFFTLNAIMKKRVKIPFFYRARYVHKYKRKTNWYSNYRRQVAPQSYRLEFVTRTSRDSYDKTIDTAEAP